MKIIFVVFFVVLCALFILLNILGAMNEDRKVRSGVNNTDTFSQNFCYVTKMDKKSIIERLSIHSGYDKLEYTFDSTKHIITFINFGTKTEYQLQFIEKLDCTYLEASRIHFFSNERSDIYKINPFFVTKLGVEPFDYSEYLKIKDAEK